MPATASASLTEQISHGAVGIREVTQSLCDVDSANAEAWDKRDEVAVKTAIRQSVGFSRVNQHVRNAMVHWVGATVREEFQQLVDKEADEAATFSM